MKSRAGYFWMLLLLAILLPAPTWAARQVHYFGCNDCHRAGMPLTNLNNLCLKCHDSETGTGTALNDGTPSALPTRKFISEDASNALGSLAAIPGYTYDPGTAKEISHLWGVGDTKPEAGATPPVNPIFAGKNNASRGKIFCARCHNAHNQDTYDRKLLKLDNSADQMCMDCHNTWYKDEVNALTTHPVGATTNYATVLAGDTDGRFKTSVENVAQGDVRLVQGYVSCTSCHGMHFTDSDSSTADSYSIQSTMDGDGHQLRTDGPTRTNKSALCQACHTYGEHGRVDIEPSNDADGVNEQVGCLVCHSGHSYDATLPNYYVLRKSVTTAGFGTKTTLVPTASTNFYDYCTACHGAVTGYTSRVHNINENCKGCHDHKAPAYSFAMGQNADICGDCHGAPPRSATRATRGDMIVETGFADGPDVDYNTGAPTQYYKDETRTPHKRHAGALNVDKVAVDYAFGSTAGGLDSACSPCHNDRADTVTPTHDNGVSNGSFQSIYYDNLATYNGLLTPSAYSATVGTCANLYCHSNGGRRPTTGVAKGTGDFKTATTPAWANGSNNTTNIGAIVGTANECQQCHGTTVATMAIGGSVTQKGNSQTHNRHLTKLGDNKNTCYLCHSSTADSAGNVPAAARDHRNGGTHVNGAVNVVFSPVAFGSKLVGGTYNGAVTAGTCTVYCHTNGKGAPPSVTPDWDDAATGACGTCHPATNVTQTNSSHARHLNLAKANIKCDACHGSGASAGTHGGHVDGVITKLTVEESCDLCHGVETALGDTSPEWGNTGSINCKTCHTGSVLTSYVNAASVTVSVTTANRLAKTLAATKGHGLPNGSQYSMTGIYGANKDCSACHTTIGAGGHVDGIGNSKLLVGGFSCESCHSAGGSRTAEATVDVATHSGTKYVTFSKACLACHDPHGTSNLAMIETLQSTQNGKDASGTEYSGDVVFTSVTKTGTDSFDENDAANADDLCATCHVNTTHNSRTLFGNHAGGNYNGTDCTTTCHPHSDGFQPAAGSACNGCHGFPPNSGAHGDGGTFAIHAKTTSTDKDEEDRSDCEVCHTGAASYTYSDSLDRANSLNHGNDPGRLTILFNTVGYQKDAVSKKWYCSNACHQSNTSDGFWYIWDDVVEPTRTALTRTGMDTVLECNSCHYWNSNPTSGGNVTVGKSEGLSTTHSRHFARSKVCVNCHADNGADTLAPHTHINAPDALWVTSPNAEGTILNDRGNASQDEATVTFASATTKYNNWNDGTNSCGVATANNGLGCHATGNPTWGQGARACADCHTDRTTQAVNPVSGLHAGPITISGKVHDQTLGSGCAVCHTQLTAQSTHQNGLFQGGNGQTVEMGLFTPTYNQTGNDTGTCSGSGVATGCHSDAGAWARRWSVTAKDSSGSAMCANCHGSFSTGWNTGVVHAENSARGSGHSSTGSLGYGYPCTDCHVIGASTNNYLFALGSNDWNMVEGGTTKHGNNKLEINSTETFFSDAAARVGCANGDCHPIDSSHDYPKSTIYTTANTKLVQLAGVKPPVTCYNCHGGTWSGPNQSNYWPDKLNSLVESGGTSEDNEGRHDIHMQRLARAVYNEDYKTELLTDYTPGNFLLTSDQKQQALCDYCHAGASNHGSKANLPAQVTTMYNLWLPKTADDAAWNSPSAGNCANVNCHNGKATSLTTNFTWYGNGTKNCVLCHNDITDTTGGTTGATHAAHTGSAAIFGKDVNCSSCHGGSPSWSPYTVATATAGNSHIDGQFKVGTAANAAIAFAYGGSYTDFDTGTVGDCSINLCHNNGKNTDSYRNGGANYNWKTAFAGCTACHRTDFNLGSSHNAHLFGSFPTTFGKTLYCDDCHEAGTDSTSDMSGKTAHMDGAVTLAAGLTYSGTPATLTVGGTNTYGSCTGSCHTNGKGTDPVTAATWNSSYSNCNICHDLPNTSGNDGLRHSKHIGNTAYVGGSCGECHLNATTTTYNSANHLSGTVQTGNKITIHTVGTAGCTNNCHVVDTARGDWLDTDVLGCADCHVAGKVGAALLPTSGLHAVTPRISGKKHDATVHANGCEVCHTTIRTQTTTHIKGSINPDSTSNNDRGLFSPTYSDATGSCMGTGVNLLAGCHRDNGDWGRKWTTTVANNDGTECANCHGGISTGYTAAAWVAGISPDHTANWDNDETPDEVMTKHSVCKTCHGFAGESNKDDNYVLTNLWNQGGPDTSMHGNSKITMNGGTQYNAGDYGCDNAGCHGGAAASHALADSAWTVELGPFAAGSSCYGCHGNGSNQYWPDNPTTNVSAWPDRAGAHAQHIPAIARKMVGGDILANRNATCVYCHPGGAHFGDQDAAPADVSNTDTNNDTVPDGATASSKMKKIIGGVDDLSTPYGGYFRAASTDKTCSNVACHANAPYTPGWYGDTMPPAAVTGLATAAGTEPGTASLSWIAPGDDNGDDGTAYMYDVRYSNLMIDSDAAFNNAARAGAPPTVDRMSKQQTMTVKGLTPGQNYYFAVKTRDEVVTNWSPLAYTNSPRQAQPDNIKPVFWGLDKVVVADTTGAVNLSWAAARDHTLPIDYLVYYGMAPTTYASPQVITRALNYRVTGLTAGKLYYFAVRARDAAGNPAETNTLELQAMPTTVTELPWADKVYYASGASVPPVSLVTTGYPGTANTMPLPATFAISSNYAKQTNVLAGTFAIYVDNGTSASAGITATLGHWNGSSFTSLGQTASSGAIAAKARRVVKFAFNNARVTVPANSKLAIQITGTGIDLVGWGTTAYRGDIQVKEQTYNTLPTAPTITAPSASTLSGVINIAWNASTDADSDAIHYDVYASCTENAVTTPYVIATGLTTTSTTWDTQGDGIALVANTASCTITVDAGDSKATGAGTGVSHSPSSTSAKTVDNRTDTTSPAAVAELVAETRPKQGSAFLTWTSVGDDGTNHGSRATQYDIRYSPNPITGSTEFLNASQLYGEPVPDFSGTPQSFEALGMGIDTPYYFAIAVGDETTIGKTYGTNPVVNGNWSPITSTAASKRTGPKCGICHSTPPDEVATAGKHSKHGYTMTECGNCHTYAARTFTTDHQDGVISLGFKTDTPATPTVGSGTIVYNQDPDGGGPLPAVKIYEDTNGVGGFNGSGATREDNGTCFGFSSLGVSGCHGSAQPNWDTETPSLACSACHGTSGRVNDTYGRPYDDASVAIQASPPKDNHGYDGLPTDPIAQRKYVGHHEKHLNFSFRFAKGDSCRLCHLNAVHYDGNVQVEIDKVAAGKDTALWTAGADANTPGTCSGTGATACHNGASAVPTWDSNVQIGCNNCHDMENKAYTVGAGYGTSEIPHVYLTVGGTVADCNACHVEGHPQDVDGDTSTFMIPNNMSVGINYRSGGIHLKKTIASRGPFNTEAEICWGCHSAVGISEWGANKGHDVLNDLGQRVTGYTTPYNYGSLEGTANWIGAIWKSAYGQSSGDPFYYKRGKIQSTHSTNPAGTAKVTWSSANGRYDETLDAVDKIRCSNCHDVHDLNKATGDVAVGGSLLRGTWRGNPYEEDGAPSGTITRYTAVNDFGAVPRAGSGYKQLGGYYIDQNNVTPGTGNTTLVAATNPTAGWSTTNSAGLCLLCHSNVDSMDQVVDGNLWIGTNGHSNAVVGGTGSNKANVFDFSRGRPTPVGDGGGFDALDVPSMGFFNYYSDYLVNGVRGYGYRGEATAKINTSLTPSAGSQKYSYKYYDWGASVDAGSVDPMYHTFSCSKCHNPHASRLPKLMISNCLDSRHNTWDNAMQTQTWWTNTADNGRQLAFWSSAQNCHRYDDQRAASATRGPVTTISFQIGTGTGGRDRILDSGNGLGVFTVGENILVSGSTSNNRHFMVLARPSNGIIEVAVGSVTAENAGSSITITNPKPKGGWNVVTPWVRENINNTVHQ